MKRFLISNPGIAKRASGPGKMILITIAAMLNVEIANSQAVPNNLQAAG